MLEDRVAVSVARPIGVFLLTNRQRSGSPNRATLLVTQVDDLRLRIRERIVAPRSQAIGLAIPAPREAEPALGYQGAKARVRHHVAPRCRRCVASIQVDRVFVSVLREPADP